MSAPALLLPFDLAPEDITYNFESQIQIFLFAKAGIELYPGEDTKIFDVIIDLGRLVLTDYKSHAEIAARLIELIKIHINGQPNTASLLTKPWNIVQFNLLNLKIKQLSKTHKREASDLTLKSAFVNLEHNLKELKTALEQKYVLLNQT